MASILVLALVVLYQGLAPAWARSADRRAQRKAGARLEGILAGVDAGGPVVQVGQSSCGYSLSYDARGREVWKLVPPTADGGVPRLRALDDRTVEVRTPAGGALAFATTPPPDPSPRRTSVVPPLFTAGWQRLGLGTAHALERSGDAVIAFRLAFDRPLTSYVFVQVSGCVALEPWRR